MSFETRRNKQAIEYTVQDGNKVEIICFPDINGYYAVAWDGTQESPNTFFQKAQDLIQRLKGKTDFKPHDGKLFSGLDYSINGDDLEEVDMEDFVPQPELDSGRPMFARFNSLYGDFVYGFPDNPLRREIITHVTAPEEMADFVSSTSSVQTDKTALVEVLKEVGRSLKS
jgi:hypothetical protein